MMISFFRKIRQRFFRENRISKYIIYAIGEIALVVVGILIALQVNNWNHDRLNKNLEAQYYKRLLEDLEEDKAIMTATLNYSNQVILHAKNAMLVYEGAPKMNANPRQNLIDLYQASQLQDPNSAQSTYKELISSGQINLIRSDSLKTALIRFYETNWDKTTVFVLPNKYRENLRSKMPDAIQTEIRENCGDKYIKIRNGYEVVLPTKCSINLDLEIAKKAVLDLKSDESLKKDLRYLIGNEDAKILHVNAVNSQLDELIKLIRYNLN